MSSNDDPSIIRRPSASKVGVPLPPITPVGAAWPGEASVRDFLGLASGERVVLSLASGPVSVVRKIGAEDPPPAPGVVLAGSLSRMAVPDALSIVHATGLEGELVFHFSDATKRIALRGGAIIFASSTLIDDRLGEMLVGSGRISRKAFAEASEECVREKKKFGRVLVERGLLTAHELFGAVREQVEAIVLSLFTYSEGTFVFTAAPLAITNPISLEHPVSHYVLEGVRRSDELRRALEEVSDKLAVFKPSGRAALAIADGRPGTERDVAALVDGVSTVWQIIAKSVWSEANTLLALARLVRAGLIRRASAEEVAAGAAAAGEAFDELAAATLVEAVNDFFMLAHAALKKASGRTDALEGFFDAVKPEHRSIFSGVSFDSAGSIDVMRIVSNFASLPAGQQEAARVLREALNDVIDFALWCVSDQVAADEVTVLLAKARRLREGKTT